MDVALALDISTSVIGCAVIEHRQFELTALHEPILMTHIDLRKNKGGMWSKIDQAEIELTDIINGIRNEHHIKSLYVEDPVEKFRTGLSSAHTIALLAKFNALVSNHARKLLKLDPLYIDATEARKRIGVPLLSKKKSGGVDQKEQTFLFLKSTVFMNRIWPLNRTNKIQPWCYDEVDAAVICWAGLLGLGYHA